MKKAKLLAMSLIASVCLTGCGLTVTMDVTDSKAAKVTTEMVITKAEANDFGMDDSAMKECGYKKRTSGGKTEYVASETQKYEYGSEELGESVGRSFFYMSDDETDELLQETIEGTMGGADSSEESEYEEMLKDLTFDMKVKFPKKVVVTNGKVSKNNRNVVTFDIMKASGSIYAYTSDYKDNAKPVVKGVQNGKRYKKPVMIKFSDKSALKTSTLDGKKIKSGKKVTAAGKHTLIVEDVFGNKTVVKFTVK